MSLSLRNIALFSHSGAGKTTLSEAILFNAGAISRIGRAEDGTTTSDYEPEETRRRISISLSALFCQWRDTKLNILDAPGYADFVGEVRAAVRVADGAVVVVCAVAGVEVGTEQVWGYLNEAGLPRIIFVNKMDRENADFLRVMEQIQATFGRHCVPLHLPIGSQANFQGVVDLITKQAHPGPGQLPPSMADQVEAYRDKLVEALADADDELLAKYLDGEEIGEEEAATALKRATLSGKVVPILTGSALQNVGVVGLTDALCRYLPSLGEGEPTQAVNAATQADEVLPAEDAAPLSALVFKTTADPYVGRLSLFRVYSGTLFSDSQVWNATKGRGERVGQLYILRGKTQEPVNQLGAGGVGAVAKLVETSTGDTLSGRDHPVTLAPPIFPKPVLGMAIYPKSKGDVDKMGPALTRLAEEDPTLLVTRNHDTQEVLLYGMGEAQLEVAVERMKRKFGAEVETKLPKVAYKETITIPVKAEYKHKKQTGGHGQFGHVFLELVPLARGSGYVFEEKVVGGAVPKNYIPAVEKGVAEASQEGVLAHYAVVDVKVKLYDGSFHPVDSSDMSFKIAGAMAVKKGLSQAHPVLLEPIMNIQVTVPEAYTGDTIGILNSKRARVVGTASLNGMSVIEAQVPLAEVLRYATELRSITKGRGHFIMEYSHYQEVPSHAAQKIIAEANAD